MLWQLLLIFKEHGGVLGFLTCFLATCACLIVSTTCLARFFRPLVRPLTRYYFAHHITLAWGCSQINRMFTFLKYALVIHLVLSIFISILNQAGDGYVNSLVTGLAVAPTLQIVATSGELNWMPRKRLD